MVFTAFTAGGETMKMWRPNTGMNNDLAADGHQEKEFTHVCGSRHSVPRKRSRVNHCYVPRVVDWSPPWSSRNCKPSRGSGASLQDLRAVSVTVADAAWLHRGARCIGNTTLCVFIFLMTEPANCSDPCRFPRNTYSVRAGRAVRLDISDVGVIMPKRPV